MASVRPDTVSDPLIGQTVGGRYVLLRRIGKGGMGVVYEADHTGLGKRVAVKLLLDKYTDDPEVVARFQREARTASAIGDEHIVEVTDAGVHDDGRSYIVMELLEGSSLADALAASGPMPAQRAVDIVRQVLRGLGAAHAKGIVHRDMKPENVFLVTKGERVDFAKIMDFGISKFMMSTESKVRLTATGAVIGTPVYMAPEQAMALGEVDARVDLYAVGVMLYEMLAGHPPFQAPSYIALVTQHLNLPPPPLGAERPDLPRRLVGAVHHALEKDPARRFQTSSEMAAALPSPDQLVPGFSDQLSTLGTSTDSPAVLHRALPGHYSTPGTSLPPPGASYWDGASANGKGAIPTGSQLAGLPAVAPVAPARSRWPIAIAGLAVLAAAVILAIGLGGGGGGGAKAPEPSASSGAAELDASTSVEPAADIGSLEIVSQPAGATVFVDGVERGKTPIVVAEVAAGIHEIRLVKDGFLESSMKKPVRAGRDETVSMMLAAAPAVTSSSSKGARPGHGGHAAKGDPPKTDPPKTDPPKTDPPKTDPPKTDPPKADPPGGPRNPYGDDDPPRDNGPGSGKKKNPYD